MNDVTHQLAASLGSGWIIEPGIAGLDELVLPRPHLLMHASPGVLDAVEQAHATIAALWPTLPPGFAEQHDLLRVAGAFADGYDMLRHPARAPDHAEGDPLRAWGAPAARGWLREHGIKNAESDRGSVFVDFALGALAVAGLFPQSWHRRTAFRQLTLADHVPILAAAIEPLGWFMLHLDSNGESPRLLLYVAGERHWDMHEPIRRSILSSGIAHAYAERVGGVWRVRSSPR